MDDGKSSKDLTVCNAAEEEDARALRVPHTTACNLIQLAGEKKLIDTRDVCTEEMNTMRKALGPARCGRRPRIQEMQKEHTDTCYEERKV